MQNGHKQEPIASNKDSIMLKTSEPICYLCGGTIQKVPEEGQMVLAMDHIPPKQFFPKKIRQTQALNLQLVPSHNKCNENYKNDEEYFYHCMYPLVHKHNRKMAEAIYEDLRRRSNKPQTPAMARRILKNFRFITDGGIHLPAGIVQFAINEHRIQRVALKISRGLIYLETNEYMPLENAKDIRLCFDEKDIPEIYQLLWKASPIKGAYMKVFSYKYFEFDGHHLLSTLYWESFMFCTMFDRSK